MTTLSITDRGLTTYSRWVDVPSDLATRTQLRREGRKVPSTGSPRAHFQSYYYRRTYELFSRADTVAVASRPRNELSVLSFAENSLASAIQTVNDAAKRRRDAASRAYSRREHGWAQVYSSEKAAFYELKDAVLARLIEQGRAAVLGHHSKTDYFDPRRPRLVHVEPDEFEDDFDFEVAFGRPPEVRTTVLQAIRFGDRTFHRPVDSRADDMTIDRHLGDGLSPARPLGSIRLRDAEATLRAYLMQPRVVLPCEVVNLAEHVSEGQLIEAITVPWLAICREVDRDPHFLYKFTQVPDNFEEFIAACYSQAGFDEVVLTPRSGDHGRDVIAVKRGHLSLRFLDQCKAYSANHVVRAETVRAMLGVVTGDRNTSKGVITTTATFAPGIDSDPIVSPYIPHRLELRDGRRLREWLLRIVSGTKINL